MFERVTRTRLHDDEDDDDESVRLSRIEGSMMAEDEGAPWFASRSSVSSPCHLHPSPLLIHPFPTPLLSLGR